MKDNKFLTDLFDGSEQIALKELLAHEFEKLNELPIKMKKLSESDIGEILNGRND